MKSGAEFSQDRKYRYLLWREWDGRKPYAMFIGLNPSTADETKDDATIRRLIRFAYDWKFGGMFMLNIFAYRATDPKEMKSAENPIGEIYNSNNQRNDDFIFEYADRLSVIKVVACWGNHGRYLDRGNQVRELLKESQGLANIGGLQAFKMTKQGQPSHPLYLPQTATTKAI